MHRDAPWLYLEDVTLLLPPLELAAWRDVALSGDTAVNIAPQALQLMRQLLTTPSGGRVQAVEGPNGSLVFPGDGLDLFGVWGRDVVFAPLPLTIDGRLPIHCSAALLLNASLHPAHHRHGTLACANYGAHRLNHIVPHTFPLTNDN